MKAGVVVFPGSNCDHDAYHVVKHVMKASCTYLWHKDEDLQGCDLVILPGGFSYGDYMRTGAIARFSPIMKAVRRFADGGGRVLGICNGFQILLEAGLLPGAMLKNVQLKFVCRHVHIRVETAATPYTARCAPGRVLRVPVAHHEGNYYADEATLEDLRRARPDRVPLLRPRRPAELGGQPERLAGQHRRHLQPRAQRPGHDAPPRAGRRGDPGLGRRQDRVRVPDGRVAIADCGLRIESSGHRDSDIGFRSQAPWPKSEIRCPMSGLRIENLSCGSCGSWLTFLKD